ncbi:LysR family transcriptional regulator [Cellulomonas soli]|uniref:LysR family transcriptional regulator n=1 Tax=Cellulomonas soli TaxID=931535 RepID=A0A512P8G3_9CELL|nr:LysR family transcriptional regulator [Cellulomonas soli]NYI57715.1 DNA-binding transcriptional LysR family regulator [Cellulomonas soli]GEP67496.1 LysR family transcriptional regulator [Cellulomonas soli]
MTLTPAPATVRARADVDLNLLRTFLAVYRAGSLTAAAPLLRLSQPTVTTQLRTLEQHLDRELFTRLPRGVEPTPIAHELAAQVAAHLDALATLDGPAGLEGQGGTPGARRSTVHLAGPAELVCTRILPALAPLVADGLQLHVATGLTDQLLDELRTGQHELVVSTRRPTGRALTCVPLDLEEFVLVTTPAWRQRVDARLQEHGACVVVHDVPLVAYADDLPIARRYWRTVFGKRLSARASLTVPDLRGAVAAVAAGAGCSVLPRYLCEAEIAAGRLVVLHEPDEAPTNRNHLVLRPGAEANPDVLLVRDRLVQAAARGW